MNIQPYRVRVKVITADNDAYNDTLTVGARNEDEAASTAVGEMLYRKHNIEHIEVIEVKI